MKNELEKIRKEIDSALKDLNIMVSDITFKEEGKYKFLNIELDKPTGLDLDTIVEATHIINPIVDKHDISDDSYILDVVSKEKGSGN